VNKFEFSGAALVTYVACLALLFFCCITIFRNSTLWKSAFWRGQLFWAVTANTVFFGGIAVYFYLTYGFITDDITYFYGCLAYKGNLFAKMSATEFMWFLARPLRDYLRLDLPACHVLFGTLGFIGSLLFVQTLMLRMDFRNKALRARNLICFWTLTCFPNFLAWGRFFGKDSAMFFLTGIFVYNASKALSGQKGKVINIISILATLIVMYRLRPHLFAVMLAGFSFTLLMRAFQARTPNIGLRGIYQLIFPVVLSLAAVLIFSMVVRRVSMQSNVSVEVVQSSFVNASRMGAYGGSATGLRETMTDDPTVIFRPLRIALNVILLFFAPFPWQIRGGADAMAFVSNLFFFYLLYRYRKTFTTADLFQKYLLINIVLLTMILSFMSGNVGLILREKTILLPFVFMFIFYRELTDRVVKPFAQGRV